MRAPVGETVEALAAHRVPREQGDPQAGGGRGVGEAQKGAVVGGMLLTRVHRGIAVSTGRVLTSLEAYTGGNDGIHIM